MGPEVTASQTPPPIVPLSQQGESELLSRDNDQEPFEEVVEQKNSEQKICLVEKKKAEKKDVELGEVAQVSMASVGEAVKNPTAALRREVTNKTKEEPKKEKRRSGQFRRLSMSVSSSNVLLRRSDSSADLSRISRLEGKQEKEEETTETTSSEDKKEKKFKKKESIGKIFSSFGGIPFKNKEFGSISAEKLKIEKLDPIDAGAAGKIARIRLKDLPSLILKVPMAEHNLADLKREFSSAKHILAYCKKNGIDINNIPIGRMRKVKHLDVIDKTMASTSVGGVMPYYNGGNLKKFLINRQPPLTDEQKKDLALQIAWGLEIIHEAGLFHHDIKLENICIDVQPDGKIKAYIIDFGTSRHPDDLKKPTADNKDDFHFGSIDCTVLYCCRIDANEINSNCEKNKDYKNLKDLYIEKNKCLDLFSLGLVLAQLYSTPPATMEENFKFPYNADGIQGFEGTEVFDQTMLKNCPVQMKAVIMGLCALKPAERMNLSQAMFLMNATVFPAESLEH